MGADRADPHDSEKPPEYDQRPTATHDTTAHCARLATRASTRDPRLPGPSTRRDGTLGSLLFFSRGPRGDPALEKSKLRAVEPRAAAGRSRASRRGQRGSIGGKKAYR